VFLFSLQSNWFLHISSRIVGGASSLTPSVRVSDDSFALLMQEARKLGISVTDLLDSIVSQYFSEGEEPEEDLEEGEDAEKEPP